MCEEAKYFLLCCSSTPPIYMKVSLFQSNQVTSKGQLCFIACNCYRTVKYIPLSCNNFWLYIKTSKLTNYPLLFSKSILLPSRKRWELGDIVNWTLNLPLSFDQIILLSNSNGWVAKIYNNWSSIPPSQIVKHWPGNVL